MTEKPTVGGTICSNPKSLINNLPNNYGAGWGKLATVQVTEKWERKVISMLFNLLGSGLKSIFIPDNCATATSLNCLH